MAATLFSSKDSDKSDKEDNNTVRSGGAAAVGALDQLSIGSRTPLSSMPRAKSGATDLTILLRHHTGDLRQVATQHLGSSVGDIKAQYLELVSRLPSKEQLFLVGDFNAAHLRSGGSVAESILASAARRFGAGQQQQQLSAVQQHGGASSGAAAAAALSSVSALGGPATAAGAAFNPPASTSTRFSGVLGKNFNFKNITPPDLTFATRDGHILQDAEKVAPLRRADTGIVEIFVVPPVPHRVQEPLVTVSAIFPFPNASQVEGHVVIRDYDFAAFINHAEKQHGCEKTSSRENSPGAANEEDQQEISHSVSLPATPNRAMPAAAASVMTWKRPDPIVVREVQIPAPPIQHLPPAAAVAAALNSASATSASAEDNDGGESASDKATTSPPTTNKPQQSSSAFSSGLPLPTARDLSRMSIASQQTAAAATCGDFIVHVHPEHATVIEGATNPNATVMAAVAANNNNSNSASSTGSAAAASGQPPIILSATSTHRKRAVPVSEYVCKINALYGRTENWQHYTSSQQQQHQQQQQQQQSTAANLPKSPSAGQASDLSSSGAAAGVAATSIFPAEVLPTERAVSYYSPAWWSPVHAYTSPDGNFIVLHLVPKEEARVHLGGSPNTCREGGGGMSNASFGEMPRMNSTPMFDPTSKTGQKMGTGGASIGQQQHIAGAFLIFESASRGSSWICRGAVRLPHIDTALSGWATENRFLVCVGASHCVIKVEHEGPIQVKCTTLHLSQQQPLPGASTADTAPHLDKLAGFGGGVQQQKQQRRATTLQLVRALPDYADDTMLWFDPNTQVLRISHAGAGSNSRSGTPNNQQQQQQQRSSSPAPSLSATSSSPFSGMAFHFKRRHANSLLYGYVLQSRQPKWQLQSSSLPQFVISPGESGFNGISIEEASQCSSIVPPPSSTPPSAPVGNNVSSSSAASAAALVSSSSSSPSNRGGRGGVSNNSFALSSVSMNTVNPVTAGGNGNLTQQLAVQQQQQQQQHQTQQQQQARAQPQAVYFLHQLHAAQTAPFPPDEALLLHFPQQLVYVSEHHGRSEDIFKTGVVSPPIQPGSVVAAHYFNMRDASSGGDHGSGGGKSGDDKKDSSSRTGDKKTGNSGNNNNVPSRLRIVYVSEDLQDRSTTMHVVTLQADWKAPVETGAGILDFFKKKLSFFSSSKSTSGGGGGGGGASGGGGGNSDDPATIAKAKEAEQLAIQSHKSLKLSSMEAFQHGACDCYMASAAPVGVVVKATGAVGGGVAAVRLRAI